MKDLASYLHKLHHYTGWRLYLNGFGMLVISLLEGVGILMLMPMLGLIGIFESSRLQLPYLDSILQPLSALSLKGQLAVVLALFLCLLIGQAWLQRLQINYNERLEQGYIRHLRVELYESILRSNWSFFLAKRKSDLVHIMTNELPRVNYGIYASLRLLMLVLFTVVQLGLALWLSPVLTITVLICGLLLAYYSRRFIRRSYDIGDQATSLTQAYIAGMTEQFQGIKELKSNRMEEPHITWFQKLCLQMEQNTLQFTRLQTTSQFYYKLVSGLLLVLFLYTSFVFLKVPAEKLILIVVIFSRLWPKFTALQTCWEQLYQTLPAFKSLSGLWQQLEPAQEKPEPSTLTLENSIRVTKEIRCRELSYQYEGPSSSSYALQHINLTIPANGTTAIVGKSGAGKSTFIDLLIGLLQPTSGEILIDGVPLTAARALDFRRSVSYVAQDPFLFHTSIRENLAAAAPTATEEQMWESLRFACAEEFVQRLPQGLDTVLGDRGVRLSGGERQRIVLARAILRKPSILILDEATSALDNENESKIQEALDRLKGRMTIIVIAHRLSTIRNADQVAVLERGRLVQLGSYHQVSREESGLFKTLLRYQEGPRAGDEAVGS